MVRVNTGPQGDRRLTPPVSCLSCFCKGCQSCLLFAADSGDKRGRKLRIHCAGNKIGSGGDGGGRSCPSGRGSLQEDPCCLDSQSCVYFLPNHFYSFWVWVSECRLVKGKWRRVVIKIFNVLSNDLWFPFETNGKETLGQDLTESFTVLFRNAH